MTPRFRLWTASGPAIALVLLAFQRPAGAQPAPPARAPAKSVAADADDAEAEAKEHFKSGNDHFDRQEWPEALDEFRRALALKKTRATMVNEASCLKQLGRYDEALDHFEALRAEYPDLPPTLEAKVAPAMAALKTRVGTLVLAGDTPPGASVFVDDRLRGTLPLAAALRVGVGGHVIRLEKDRFDPIVATVDISARRESTALLRATAKKGRLVVGESHGWALQVELDGKDVGVTPWEGTVETGDHQVKLKGFVGLTALTECAAPDVGAGGTPKAATDGAKVESAAVTATVRLYEVTPVALGAEERDASLRLESTPSRATVSVDSRVVGQTPWEGRLGLGEHAIELNAAGFFPATQRVQLVRHKQRELQVVLEREPDTARLRKIRSVGAGVSYGVGAVGLGVFAVTGGLALAAVKELETACPDHSCFKSEQPKLDKASTLGTMSTVGLVVGSLGVVAGTTVILLTRPPDERPRASAPVGLSRPADPSWSAGVGLGRFTVEGRF